MLAKGCSIRNTMRHIRKHGAPFVKIGDPWLHAHPHSWWDLWRETFNPGWEDHWVYDSELKGIKYTGETSKTSGFTISDFPPSSLEFEIQPASIAA